MRTVTTGKMMTAWKVMMRISCCPAASPSAVKISGMASSTVLEKIDPMAKSARSAAPVRNTTRATARASRKVASTPVK